MDKNHKHLEHKEKPNIPNNELALNESSKTLKDNSLYQKIIETFEQNNIFDLVGLDINGLQNISPSQSEINYVLSTFMFSRNKIDGYMNSIKKHSTNTKLNYNKVRLFNRDDIFNAMFYESGFGKRYESQRNRNVPNSVANYITKLTSYISDHFCSESVGIQYIENTIAKTFNITKMTRDYDILFVCDEKFADKNLTFTERLPYILSFMSIQLGECKLYEYAYSVRLICSRNNTKSAGYGSFLLGALLYCFLFVNHKKKPKKMSSISISYESTYTIEETDSDIRIQPSTIIEPYVEPIIVLEALSGYTNPSAICTYEKFGFKFDEGLLGYFCFDSPITYPMAFNVKSYVKQSSPDIMQKSYNELRDKIVDIVVGKNPGFDKHPVCKMSGKHQELLGFLLNLQYKIKYEDKFNGKDSQLTSKEKTVYRVIKHIHPDINKTITQIQMYLVSGDKKESMDSLISDLLHSYEMTPKYVTSKTRSKSKSKSKSKSRSKSKSKSKSKLYTRKIH